MQVEKKSVKVKGYRKTHNFTIEKSSLAGHTFIAILKNDNPILKCTPREFVKFRKFFAEYEG